MFWQTIVNWIMGAKDVLGGQDMQHTLSSPMM